MILSWEISNFKSIARLTHLNISPVTVFTGANSSGKSGVRTGSIPRELNLVIKQIQSFFSERIYYLGPLRESPSTFFVLPPNPDSKYVGSKGEYTDSVLDRYFGELADYPHWLKPDGSIQLANVESGHHIIIEP